MMSGLMQPSSFAEKVWYASFYAQDQWTFQRFTFSGALRYDHAESRYGESCIGPDTFVAEQWCTTPESGVRYARAFERLRTTEVPSSTADVRSSLPNSG